jgi:gamma-glutamyl phosphate reductase
LLLGFATLVTIPRGAQAYVREVTKSGVPVAWHYPCVTMHIYVGSPASGLDRG